MLEKVFGYQAIHTTPIHILYTHIKWHQRGLVTKCAGECIKYIYVVLFMGQRRTVHMHTIPLGSDINAMEPSKSSRLG